MNKIVVILVLFISIQTFSQAIYEDERYVPETDPLVLEKLDQWQDKKFGLLMHWGSYSQWGIVESWSLCPEDYGWCERKKGESPKNYYEYKKEYEGLKNTFNPVKFDPSKWSKAAKAAVSKASPPSASRPNAALSKRPPVPTVPPTSWLSSCATATAATTVGPTT